MNELPVNRKDIARPPTHPGEILGEDVLPALNLTISNAAERLGVSRQTLHRIIAGKTAVTPEMAVRLGKFCGNGPEGWLRMQEEYDLWYASRKLAKKVAKIPTMRA
jgi:addiction module HigA family antidote